jgi:arylsulfatase A-like enzyme
VSLRRLALALLAGSTGCAPSASETPERIVLIVIDTLRRDHLSCYGAPAATPNIDRLAARGQIFSNAYSSFHQTSMSMAALFTGRTPSIESGDPAVPLPWTGLAWCGLLRFAPGSNGACVPNSLDTIAERIRGAGYWTIGIASNPLLFEPAGFRRGFKQWIQIGRPGRKYLPPDELLRRAEAARTARRVQQAVIRALADRPDDRFFLYVHYMDVHDYGRVDPRANYAKGVQAADHAVGELLDQLEQEDLLDDAVVVLTADHGERLGETHPVEGAPWHQANPSFEYLIRVPLIVAPPVFDDTSRMVRSEDVFRLLEQIAGVDEGTGSELEADEQFLSEIGWQTYRRGRWKSAHFRSGKAVVLFDLDEDPGEQRDVAGEHPDVIDAHRGRVAELARKLSAASAEPAEPTPDDRHRLQVLGYLDE